MLNIYALSFSLPVGYALAQNQKHALKIESSSLSSFLALALERKKIDNSCFDNTSENLVVLRKLI